MTAVRDVKEMRSRNQVPGYSVFPRMWCLGINKKIMHVVAENASVTTIVVHTGSNSFAKRHSDFLKQDFVELLKIVSCRRVQNTHFSL